MQDRLYSGKVKSLFATDHPDELRMLFRDDMTAFDGLKIVQFPGKGALSNTMNAFIMQYLHDHGVTTHFIKKINENESLVKKMDMIPLESVVRNVTAGGLCKRLGVEPGVKLAQPILVFFLKDDPLHDPMVTEAHIRAFNWASDAEVAQMKQMSLKVNDILQPLFAKAGLILVDFKLEFGRYKGQLLVADEFSPDGCRVWDAQTLKILDKDRFRKDLGDVMESYQELAERVMQAAQ